MYYKYCNFLMQLEEKLMDLDREYSNIVILCIGTKSVTGDAIGPLVGESIKYLENEYVKIYGNFKDTINFKNAREVLSKIYEEYRNPYIITIDAALGNKETVGKILLSKGYIKIGKALEKNICFYSNINIKCVICLNANSKQNNILELKKIKYSEVFEMANLVSQGIKQALKNKMCETV